MHPSGTREWYGEEGLATGLKEGTSKFFMYRKEAEGLFEKSSCKFSIMVMSYDVSKYISRLVLRPHVSSSSFSEVISKHNSNKSNKLSSSNM